MVRLIRLPTAPAKTNTAGPVELSTRLASRYPLRSSSGRRPDAERAWHRDCCAAALWPQRPKG